MNDFRCEICKQTFNKKWPDSQAEKEYSRAAYNIPGDDIGIICGHCFREFQEWFSKLTPEEHREILGE